MEVNRRSFLQCFAAVLGTATTNPAAALQLLHAPTPPSPTLPPAFTLFSHLRAEALQPSPAVVSLKQAVDKATQLGQLSARLNILLNYEDDALNAGYVRYLGLDSGWTDHCMFTIMEIFGNVPDRLDNGTIQKALARVGTLQSTLLKSGQNLLPQTDAEQIEAAYTEAQKTTAQRINSLEEYHSLADTLRRRFLETLQDAYDKGIIRFDCRTLEDGKRQMEIRFDTQKYPEEACHYAIKNGDSIRFGVSEAIKTHLSALEKNEITSKQGTVSQSSGTYDKDYLGCGGYLTNTITITSSEAAMDRLAKDMLRAMLRTNITRRLQELSHSTPIRRIGIKTTGDAPDMFDILLASNQKEISKPLVQLVQEMPDLFPGVELQDIGSRLRVKIAHNAWPEIQKTLAQHVHLAPER